MDTNKQLEAVIAHDKAMSNLHAEVHASAKPEARPSHLNEQLLAACKSALEVVRECDPDTRRSYEPELVAAISAATSTDSGQGEVCRVGRDEIYQRLGCALSWLEQGENMRARQIISGLMAHI